MEHLDDLSYIRPKTLEEHCAPDNIKNMASTWVENRLNGKSVDILMIEGKPGTGKTKFAQLLGEKYNLDCKTFDAMDIKSEKDYRQHFFRSLNHRSITNMYFGKNSKNLVILDGFDQLNKTTYMKDIIDCVKYTNKMYIDSSKVKKPIGKKRNKTVVVYNLLILIFYEFVNKKIKELDKFSTHIYLPKVSIAYLTNTIYPKLCEKKHIPADIYKKTVLSAGGDFNQFYQIINMLFKKNVNSDIQEFTNFIGKKDIEYQLFERADLILTKDDIDMDEIIRLYSTESLIVPLMIYDHYPYEIYNQSKKYKYKNKNTVKRIAQIADVFVLSNTFHQMVFKFQEDVFNDYYGYMSVVYPRVILNSNENGLSDTRIKFSYPKMLTKVSSISNANIYYLKMKDVLFDWRIIDFYYYLECILSQTKDIETNILNKPYVFKIKKYDKNNLRYMIKKYKFGTENINTLKNCNKYLVDAERKNIFQYLTILIKEINMATIIDHMCNQFDLILEDSEDIQIFVLIELKKINISISDFISYLKDYVKYEIKDQDNDVDWDVIIEFAKKI